MGSAMLADEYTLIKNANPVAFLNELIARWDYPVFDYHEMDTAKIRKYIASKANPGEPEIQEQMKMMREALKNSADTTMSKIDDKALRKLIIQ